MALRIALEIRDWCEASAFCQRFFAPWGAAGGRADGAVGTIRSLTAGGAAPSACFGPASCAGGLAELLGAGALGPGEPHRPVYVVR